MTCPRCARPLWRDLALNLYHPRAGVQEAQCPACAAKATYRLPAYLSEGPYLYFGALLIALAVLYPLSLDAAYAVRVTAAISVFVAWMGLLALLTWTRTRIK